MTGSGTIIDPYLISTADDLYGASGLKSVAADHDYMNPMYVKQTADIDLGNTYRLAIKTTMNMDYDGDNHRITGLYVWQGDISSGLFMVVYGRFRNLGVEGTIIGTGAGSIAYEMLALPIFAGVIMENCYFKGSISATASGGLLGGMCGDVLSIGDAGLPVFRNCYVEASLQGKSYTGGMVGYGQCIVDGCYTACSFSGTGSRGGFVCLTDNSPQYVGNDSFFLNTSVSYDLGIGAGRSTTHGRSAAQLKKEATFTGWDFDTQWAIVEDTSYPWLGEITAATATPTASLASGEYPAAPLSVTLSSASSGAVIYFTLDGSTPTIASASVTSGSTITPTPPKTLKIVALAPYMGLSAVATYVYSPAATVAAPVADPPSGAVPDLGEDIVVTITCATDGASIYYTTNGTTPTSGSTLITSGSTINRIISGGTLKLIAIKAGMTDSEVVSVTYTAATAVSTPTLSPSGGAYTGPTIPVTVYCSTPGAVIRYVLVSGIASDYDPSPSPSSGELMPNEEDLAMASGDVINVPISAMFNVKAFKPGLTPSMDIHELYTSKVDKPILSPENGGTESATMPVVVTCGTASVTMYYTTDGSAPDATKTPIAHGATITVTVPQTIRVIAYRASYADSDIAVGVYTQAQATQVLPFTRFVRQVRTEPKALLATGSAAQDALELLQASPWREVTEIEATFPARNALLDGFSDQWDAFKLVGNYGMDSAGKGYQRAYEGMVAYRFKIPTDALAARDILSLTIPAYVDQWLVGGMRLAAHLSDSGYPSTDWNTIRDGDAVAATQLPMAYSFDAITTTNPMGAVLENKSGDILITYPASTAVKKYIWLYVSLEDYTTVRGFWIEGAAMIRGSGVEIEFDAAVTLDPPADATLLLPTAVFDYLAPDEDSIAGSDRYANNNATLQYTYPAAASDLMLSAYFDNALMQSPDGSWAASSIAMATATYKTTGTATVDIVAGVLPMLLGFTRGGTLSELITHTAIGDYPDWMQVRLNVYAIFAPDVDQKKASTTRVAMIAARSAWWAGTHAEDGYVNMLSVDLSPNGHPEFTAWPTKPVTIPSGLCAIYVTPQITNIVGTPAAAGTAYGLELAMSAISFRLDT